MCGLLPLRASVQVDPSRGCARALCHATYSQVLSTPRSQVMCRTHLVVIKVFGTALVE